MFGLKHTALILIFLLPHVVHGQEDSVVVSSALDSALVQERSLSTSGFTDALGAVASQVYMHSFVRHPSSLFPERTHSGFDMAVGAVPLATTWILKASGVESRSSTRRMFLSNALALGITCGTSQLLKPTVKEYRPDFCEQNSFPSGHATFAFTSATILAREYGHVSPWIPVSGYAVATASQLLRVRHNAHWQSDLSAGAAIGILGTNLAYFITDCILPKSDINAHTLDNPNEARALVLQPSLFRRHFSEYPFSVAIIGGSEGGAVGIQSDQLDNWTTVSDYELRVSNAMSVGVEATWHCTPDFGIQGLFRMSDSQVKVYASDPSLRFMGDHLNICHYDGALRFQTSFVPSRIHPIFSFLDHIFPPMLLSLRVLGGARSLSSVDVRQFTSDGQTAPFCHLPSQTRPEAGAGLSFEFVNSSRYITTFSADYLHVFSSVLPHCLCFGSSWKVLF